ncbi:MAG: hypothetical protein COA38_04405 [Fluviicola sp.]|nr:MAG: hypothetical protein COA38_04405 [Fluviicola sp.]
MSQETLPSEQIISTEPKPRLKFIDMARSIAILMMIEGHFTGAALAWEYRKPNEYILFKGWHLLHGLTSPLFFTVTGLIFVYLLIGSKQDVRFWDNIRVRKGGRRVLQLLFWGYFIQLNVWVIGKSIYYGTEFHMDWFYAFHVLQSIAAGLLFVISIYGVYRLFKFGKLYWYYLIAGTIMLIFYSLMKQHIRLDEALLESGVATSPSYWPAGAPKFIQNMFYGQFSEFSFVRMSFYTIFGGMVGAIIRSYEHKVREWWFGVVVIIAGLIISIFVRDWFCWIDDFTEYIGLTAKGVFELNSTSMSRFGQVVVLIGLLILIDRTFKIKAPLFLKIGQTTFPIYVVHVMILYGGFLGFGLKPLVFDRDLSPYAAIAISTFSLAVFVLMVKYIDPLTKIYDWAMYTLRVKKRPQKD